VLNFAIKAIFVGFYFHGRDAFAERGILEAKTGSGRPVGAARVHGKRLALKRQRC
jgi:hypothetical protein